MQPALSFLGSFPYSDAYVLSEVIVIELQVVRPVHIPSEGWLIQGPFLLACKCRKNTQMPGVGTAAIIKGFRDPVD